MRLNIGTLIFLAAFAVVAGSMYGQTAPDLTPAEKVIVDKMRHLRDLADDVRTTTTRQLALDVRAPAGRAAVCAAERTVHGSVLCGACGDGTVGVAA